LACDFGGFAQILNERISLILEEIRIVVDVLCHLTSREKASPDRFLENRTTASGGREMRSFAGKFTLLLDSPFRAESALFPPNAGNLAFKSS
jgi:hypothetical protein